MPSPHRLKQPFLKLLRLFHDVDKCPTEPEDKDGFEDTDGCPDSANDKDSILDVVDKCPLVPETINGFEDEAGCPDKGKSIARIEGDRSLILEKVFFATNKDVILDRSFNLLNQVSSTLKAHPELTKIRVEGHTNSQGDDKHNMDFSQRRAGSVKKFLEKAGIAPERLIAQGFGETKPVDDNKTAAGREKNRRVQFVVVETAATSVPAR